MNKDLHCPYSILDQDIICEHKVARVPHPDTVTLHNHDGYEFYLFLNGNVHMFVESQQMKLERGNLVIIPPFCFHDVRVTDVDSYERIVLNVRPQLIESMSDEETDFVSALNVDPMEKLKLITLDEKKLDEMIYILDHLDAAIAKPSFGHVALSKAYLTEFIVALANEIKNQAGLSYENTMSPTVNAIFNFIDANIYNELSVEIVARELHHNSDYLNRVFKNVTGGTLKYYINAKKIAHAQQLLREGHQPYDVCFMLSFNNYSSFSRCFSQHIALSPKRYALMVQAGINPNATR